MTDAERYGISVGQLYLAADGSKSAQLVTNIQQYEDVGDIVVHQVTPKGVADEPHRIDAFKLAMVRYGIVRPETWPNWLKDAIALPKNDN